MSALVNLRKKVREFHEDEFGLEALQVVMIVAVAALCLILVKVFWESNISPWFRNLINIITGWKAEDGTGR